MSKVKTIKATGADGQVNTLDVILRKAKSGSMVFFPGDISTGREEMKADEEVGLDSNIPLKRENEFKKGYSSV